MAKTHKLEKLSLTNLLGDLDLKMVIQSVIANVTEHKNDLHSWQYPAHAQKKKIKEKFWKTQENPRQYFDVKTSNKFVALEASEGLEKPKDQTANQQNALK